MRGKHACGKGMVYGHTVATLAACPLMSTFPEPLPAAILWQAVSDSGYVNLICWGSMTTAS